jgi:hypothetical protein
MAHSHSHGDQTSYYVEQIFTIASCGAIGGVCVLLYINGKIGNMLTPDQHLRVLFGGMGLVGLVLIRAVYVWIAAGKTAQKAAAHQHNHDHDHDHDHDHAHCDHDHDHNHDHDHGECGHDHHHHTEPAAAVAEHGHSHGDHDHDHGWAPWRYALILLPVVLFLLGLPKGGLSGQGVNAINEELNWSGDVSGKGDKPTRIGFNQLELACRNPERRANLAGTKVQLLGKYKGGDRQDRFTLVRFKMTCCGPDAIALKAVIMIDPSKKSGLTVDPQEYFNQWVQVTGQLQFGTLPSSNEVVPLVVLSPDSQHQLETESVIKVNAPAYEYTDD